eukprot:NODE_287_length_1997_cov_6.399897_g198_i0.p1 GENE.NODE_287_length_1997_cov_6.399897_g198_i0~~NODE_287_length_1997_cov_6.399897_g198_i0.p1  ORF type:complete len:595 (-),score=138.15 NODE_287_length_1997_cov_6.399897_g198_i0:212-1948(-)
MGDEGHQDLLSYLGVRVPSPTKFGSKQGHGTLQRSSDDGQPARVDQPNDDTSALLSLLLDGSDSLALFGGVPPTFIPPPHGTATIVFSDVAGGAKLWEVDPEAMYEALSMYVQLVRELLEEHCGYEVASEAGAFMAAFASPVGAVRWCLDLQRSLLDLPWPKNLLLHDGCGVVSAGNDAAGSALWKGLKIRMGADYGTVNGTVSRSHQRTEYFGLPVYQAACLGGLAHGGQVLLSADLYQSLQLEGDLDTVLGGTVAVQAFTHLTLKGMPHLCDIHSVVPGSLAARVFPPLNPATAEPLTIGGLVTSLECQRARVARLCYLQCKMAQFCTDLQCTNRGANFLTWVETQELTIQRLRAQVECMPQAHEKKAEISTSSASLPSPSASPWITALANRIQSVLDRKKVDSIRVHVKIEVPPSGPASQNAEPLAHHVDVESLEDQLQVAVRRIADLDDISLAMNEENQALLQSLSLTRDTLRRLETDKYELCEEVNKLEQINTLQEEHMATVRQLKTKGRLGQHSVGVQVDQTRHQTPDTTVQTAPPAPVSAEALELREECQALHAQLAQATEVMLLCVSRRV